MSLSWLPECTALASTLTGLTGWWAKDAAGWRRAPGSNAVQVSDNHSTTMTYIRDLERELRALIDEGDMVKVIRFVKDKVLESYRNGLDAAALRVEQAAEKLGQSARAS